VPADYYIARQVGTQSVILPIFVGNVTTGAGLTNVIASTVGFAWYRNDMAAASTGQCTSGTLGNYSASSFVQVLSTGLRGWYNFGIPNSLFVSGSGAALRLSTAAMEVNIFIELTKTDNQTYFSSQTLSTNAIVNVAQVLGSTPVTTAAGLLATTWDLGRTANLTSTVALTGASLNYVTTAGVALGSGVDVSTILGSPVVTTAAGVIATTWDLGRTANLTSTIALTGTSLSTNILVSLNRIFGSAPVTTAAGILSAGITGTQTYNITGSLSGSVGSVTGSVASVAGLNASLLDVSVSSRLANASYAAPLDAAGTRTAVGLSTASLDDQLSRVATTTQAADIIAKTSSMTFSTSSALDVNLTHINEAVLTGDGSGTPFNV
jgi:hypothetical protein